MIISINFLQEACYVIWFGSHKEYDKINVDEVYDDYFINRRYGTIGRECKWSRGTEDSNIAREIGLSGGREGIPACPTYTEEEFDYEMHSIDLKD